EGDWHGRGLGVGVRAHEDLGFAEPEEVARERGGGEVDQQDGQREAGVVAVEVDGLVEQDVGVARREGGADVAPEGGQVGHSVGAAGGGVAEQDDQEDGQQRARGSDQVLEKVADHGDGGDDQRADGPDYPEGGGGESA